MAEEYLDPSLASEWKIHSNYLTPVEYPHHFQTYVYVDVYRQVMNVQVGFLEYYTTIDAELISGSVSKDRSSDFMSTADLELVVSEDSAYKLENEWVWEDKIIAIRKKYVFLNDRFYRNTDKPDTFYAKDIGRDVTNINMGYFKVDSTSYKYDASSRTLSISCSDCMSELSKEHGSTIINYNDAKYDLTGMVIPADLDIYNAITNLLNNYSPITFDDRYIEISEGRVPVTYIPYDLEFGSDTTLFDVLKKIKELYPNRIMFIGNNFRFFYGNLPRSWCDWLYGNALCAYTCAHARCLNNLVISENVTVDKTNIHNVVWVYGREHYESDTAGADNTTTTPTSSKLITPVGAYDINDVNNPDHPFRVNVIGMRKSVIEDDNCMSDEDCINKAKWQLYSDNEFKETTSITIVDNPMAAWISTNAGTESWSVGNKIEYTSIVTGETNTYVVNKVSHSFTDGTWTIDMQQFRPTIDEPDYAKISYPNHFPESEKQPYDEKWGKWKIKPPVISNIAYGDNGKVTFTCSNEDYTEFTLFKFYIAYQSGDFYSGYWNKFIGETCTEDENKNKIFTYQFTENGTYKLKVKGYSPYYPPSDYTDVEINITNVNPSVLTNESGEMLTDENDNILTD